MSVEEAALFEMHFKRNRKFTDNHPNSLRRYKANGTLYTLHLCCAREFHITLHFCSTVSSFST